MSGAGGRETQVEPQHYWSPAYITKERVCSFWHQVDEVLRLGGRQVLEIGPGNGIVTEWLGRAGLEVTTLDFDAALAPDVVADVTALPFRDRSFDVVLCSQVLEHIPWEDACTALGEIARVARAGAVISLPDATAWAGVATPLYHGLWIEHVRRRMAPTRVGLALQLLRRELRWRDVLWARLVPPMWALGGRTLELPRWLIPGQPFPLEPDGEHHYEIGSVGHPLELVRAGFADAGLRIQREFRVPENPWHRFFVAVPAGA